MKKIIYIFNDGEIKRKDNTIYFETEDKRNFIPIEDVSDFFIFGEVSLNKKFLDYISQKEIIIHFFNYYGYYMGSYYPREHLNSGYVTLKQSEHYLDEEKRYKIANSFVEGSYKNMLNVLKYYSNRGKNLSEVEEHIKTLSKEIYRCESINELMGIEGNIREIYYRGFDEILEGSGFEFIKRSRRPPENKLNSLISFGNSMIYVTILSEIYKTHLDPRIGYLHSTNFRRFTLNLDISEIFKPIIVDRLIFTFIGKKMITEKDFEEDVNGIILKDKARKVFAKGFDDRLRATIKHRDLGRNVSYRRLMRMELYKLEKHIIGEKNYDPYISRW
ncbi:type I-B CRISPR-associated endonuclease Cas1 [Clostridium sp. D2Q-14]|uniref:type I-B CRISPR-associated endonuclease Cas1b n=1 Tax=Anaeromonas gelatinilytica TaxID=2683194 RepID=UPI00193BA0A9|nr:type I-B CRISPR-associated endonuclease Cas1b [Anaeromonas gelatinilytica]MBS4535592.1 type I-B CRISPR-associated endonuclease Cas1 [Anaeromonas gelatinilytica]